MIELPELIIEDEYPLSPAQQGYLAHSLHRSERGGDSWQVVCTLNEPVDTAKLLSAWESVVARHDILRTSFEWEGRPEPVQKVHRSVRLPAAVLDWRHLDSPQQLDRLASLMAEERSAGFHLDQAPLMRLAIMDCGSGRHELLCTFHCAILDSRSVSILIREVFGLYDASQGGPPCRLPTPRPYRTYVDWLGSQKPDASHAFWRRHLAGLSAPTPFLQSVRAGGEAGVGSVEVTLTTDETRRLHVFAREANCTVRTLVAGAWALLLSRHTGEDDVLFGVTRACRRSTFDGADDVVGAYVHTLPFRVAVVPGQSVVSWLADLRAEQLACGTHEHTPLARIHAWSDIPSGAELFETLVVFDGHRLDATLRRHGGPWLNRRFACEGHTGYPVTLVCRSDAELVLRLEHTRRALDESTATRMLTHVRRLLEGLVKEPNRPISDIPMLGDEERTELLPVPRPSGIQTFCLHERFERRVAEAPNSPAVTFLGTTESYDALNRRANQLAHRLRTMGVGPDILVGLHLERSVELIAAMLGILKAGGAYVPLDPAIPTDNLRSIVYDARLSIIVTSRSLSARLPASGIEIAYVDEVDGESVDNPSPVAEPDNLAYVVYGSECSARPPGVLITHANVSRLFDASEIRFRFGRDDVWTLSHSFASDFAAWETWGALLYGGRLVVVPYWVGCDPDTFIDLLAREGVTVLHQTPAAFQRLSDTEGERIRPAALALRSIVLGGEAVDASSLGPWFERHGDERPQVVSMFGIAETTIHAAYRPLVKEDVQACAGNVIGVPIADLDVYVLDRLQRLVPIGVTGEIYVGGPGVGRGYLDRPELTHARFVVDPVGGTGARLFRTGELGRWLPSGELESRGRIDGQAVRHWRIAPGKLEAASDLASHRTLSGSLAVGSPDSSSIPRRATSDVPLTPLSRWFLDRSVANPNHWNHSILVEVPGHFDVSALDVALAAVVAHHDAFRLRFKEGDRGWQCGYALAGPRIAVERVDLREYPPEMVSRAIESAAAAAQGGLHITDGPILRVLYFGCGSELPGRLLVTMHRLVADARSIRVFLEDLETAYAATRAGREPWLPNRTTSFRFWAERLVDYASTRAQDGLSSWTSFADPLAAVLPCDHAAGAELNTEASARTVTVCLTAPETDALLRRTARGHGAGVDGLLLAALAKTLLPWVGRNDVVVDVERSCRADVLGNVNLSRTIGAFTATFPCRLEAGDGSTASLLNRIQHSLRVHDGGLSFGVLRFLSPDTDIREALDRVPKPQLRFHYEGDVEASIAGSSLFASAAEPIGPSRADENERPHLVEVVALVAAGRFKVQWRYSSAFHDTSTISALASRYLEALRDVAAHSEAQSTLTSSPSPFELADLDQVAAEQLGRRYPTLTDVYPLTPLQQISFSMDGIESAPAFEQWEVQLDGQLDGPRLRDAWEHVVATHPILRSAFVHVGATRTRQVVLERVDVPWRAEDWRGCTQEEIDGLLREFLAVDRARSFDLGAPPLVRASLLRTGESTHRLILSVHHLIADSSSRPRMLSELAALYDSGLAALRAPVCAYREYVGWLQRRNEAHSEQFWRVLLSGVVNPIPLPAPPSARAHYREPPGEAVRALTAAATIALTRFARSHEISLDAIVGAAWSVVLAHHSGESDVVYGVPFAGRPDEIDNVETMVGPCVNNLPVRVHVDTRAGVTGWLRQLQGLLVELAPHQTTPSRSIHSFSGIRAWRRVFDSLVVVQDCNADGTARLIGGVEMRPLPSSHPNVHPATMNVRVGTHLTVEAVGAGGRFGGKSATVAADDLVRVLTRLAGLDEGGTVADLMAALPVETRGGAGRAAAEGRRRRRPRLAPRTELERALVEIWRELFDGDIGTDENYFDLGAHSLMLLRALERIRSTVKRDLPMAALFQHPTVRDFAAYLTSGGPSHHRHLDVRSRNPQHPSHAPSPDRRPEPVELDWRL